jgi:hypothetical protein
VTVEVLSQRRLNRALLARQLLLERATLPIPTALERMGGIQNQYAPNAYIRLWSCLDGFARDDLTRAYERGSVVQGTLMRGTIHTVSARDYRQFSEAIREPMRAWARRAYRTEDRGRDEVVARVRTSLRGRTMRRAELQELRGNVPNATWATIDIDAGLLRVPPSGTWDRRRADVYALAEDRLRVGPRRTSGAALEQLVRSYLRGFGPASVADVSSYCGVPITAIRGIVEGMSLRRFRDEGGGDLVDLPRAPLPDAETPAPVRFLPTWDATLLVHARRTLILPEEHRAFIFNTKMPPSYPTFLVDGQVAGTWKYADGEVMVTPFVRLPSAADVEVRAEADRLAAFHAG